MIIFTPWHIYFFIFLLMATFILILKLFAALIWLFVILFFIYAMRWNVMEKQIRKALEFEFKNKTDQALDLIKRENEANEFAFKEKQADLMKKREEAEAMQSKNIHSWRSQMKTEIFAELLSFIESHYTSQQTKTKLKSFCVKFKEQLKI